MSLFLSSIFFVDGEGDEGGVEHPEQPQKDDTVLPTVPADSASSRSASPPSATSEASNDAPASGLMLQESVLALQRQRQPSVQSPRDHNLLLATQPHLIDPHQRHQLHHDDIEHSIPVSFIQDPANANAER